MKFNSKITVYGPDALEFMNSEDNPFIILFNHVAPEGLYEISVMHTPSNIFLIPEIGDMLFIDEKMFTITAIGDEAAHTLKELGHCTICFNGADEPDRPGCIMVQGDEKLTPDDLYTGARLQIF